MIRSIRAKGFTLIELLVVIAIIGILASVVLASLATARSKGNDAAVKSNLVNARTQAELFYSNNDNAYVNGSEDLCTVGSTVGGTDGINALVLAAAQAAGIGTVSLNTAGGSGIAVCNSSATDWAAEVPLTTIGAGFFCVDSTGIASTSSASNISSGADLSCLP